jgi:hypothetical protein
VNRFTWLLIAAALFAIPSLTAIGPVANASLPTDPVSAPHSFVVTPEQQSKVETFDCSQIEAKNINKQMNLHATQIMEDCGRSQGAIPQQAVKSMGGDFSPNAYGGTDVNVHPSNSNAIQSETFSWYNAGTNTMLVLYNDLTGGSTGKGSYSTDGGATFARLPGTPFATGHGTNFGDPAVVYDVLHGKWIATWLASGCGGQGVGAWTSPDGITWAAGGCAATVGANNGDRNSAWQDNTPTSPFYGRSYVSYNDFGIGGGALRVAWSTDGGTTWAAPVSVTTNFIRDVQLTGLSDGTLVLAGMNEGGGGANNRTNMFYRSTNGGASWMAVTANTYAPPGNSNCAGSGASYFRVITPQIRFMGYGQPAGGPDGVVHYAYAAHGSSTDEGDIYYIRSTDGGVSWSIPLRLNTDGLGRAQWMPSVAVTPDGVVFVKWYDRRDTANNDYWIYGRASFDNGVNWQSDMAVSDAVIPQPTVQTANCYMGDYDYWHGDGTKIQGAWTDSRGSGGNQDVFHDTIDVSQGTPTPTLTGTPPASTATRTATTALTNTATSTNIPVVTFTAISTNTSTSVVSTATATGTATSVVVTATATSTLVPTAQPTSTSTIGIPTSTSTAVVATPSNTPIASATNTVAVTATATACTITFTDVDETNVFYSFIQCLACRGIISGYDDGTFRPFNDITRGQIAKMVSNAAGFGEDPGPQIYEDVPPGSPFYIWINRLSNRGHMGGYPCGLLPEEPCIEPGNMPYFRPSNSATRGQLSKIVANAAGINTTPSGMFYTDVPEDHTFYVWIMRLTELGVMSGYDCGGEGEPCDDENRPYFRPYNNVTRGQASKIVANIFFPGCETP